MKNEAYPLMEIASGKNFPKDFVRCRKIKKNAHGIVIPFLVAFIEQVCNKNLLRDLINYLEGKDSVFGTARSDMSNEKFLKLLNKLNDGKIDLERYWNYIKEEKHSIVSSFNKIRDALNIESDNDIAFLETMSKVFRIYIELYCDNDELEKFPEENPLMKIYLYNETSKTYAFILYPIGVAEELNPIAANIITAIIDLKVLEARTLKSIAKSEDLYNIEDINNVLDTLETFTTLKDKHGLKTDKTEKRMKEWKFLPIESHSLDKLHSIIDELKKAAQVEVQAELDKVYCLNCPKRFSNEERKIVYLRCGHQVCLDCCRKAVEKRERFVMNCPLDNCKYVLNSTELELVDFPKKFIVQTTDNCGICGCQTSEVNSRCLHETTEKECHSLCFDCLRAYVVQVTGGKVYEYQTIACKLKDYPCPFLKCNKKFGYEITEAGFKEDENIKLLKRARLYFLKTYSR